MIQRTSAVRNSKVMSNNVNNETRGQALTLGKDVNRKTQERVEQMQGAKLVEEMQEDVKV